MKTMKNMTNKKIIIAFLIISFSFNLSSASEDKPIEQMDAKEIYYKYRHASPMEPKAWKAIDSRNNKDMIKLDNQRFSVIYPKCLNAVGEMDDENPKTSASVRFDGSKCIDKDFKQSDFSIGLTSSNTLKKVSDAFVVNPLTRTPVDIGGQKWYLLTGVTDFIVPNKPIQPQLSWDMFTICNGKTFQAGTSEIPGSRSLERIKAYQYDPPEFFQKIVSSFRCSGH